MCPEKADLFSTVSLSGATMTRRIEEMGDNLQHHLQNSAKKLCYFSLALDKSNDVRDSAQLLIFMRGSNEYFEVTEELAALQSIKGTTTGVDIYEKVCQTVNGLELDWAKLASVTTDGAPSMVGSKRGVTAHIKQEMDKHNHPHPIAIHCLIHQQALCFKSLKWDSVMKIVITAFLLSKNKEVPELNDAEWKWHLAFLTDITELLNSFNLQLQGKGKLICDMASHVKAFEVKLGLLIKQVPGLVTLKKLPCVSFAGVDSLDDVKNHTYNELFISGGFIVSDESILNPEVITIENLKNFLTFLEELSTPEGKWQWKVHCKFQKKLKELGRLNAKALSLLTLLNVYQKKHLVEILSYHNCDSQARNAPELDCLIRLQAQNIQQLHIVFLTEKNIQMPSSYTDSGIVVASAAAFMQNFKDLVGYHNLVTEENLPLLGANENLESQSALLENDEKDEEDMSLDSGDEISQIEVYSSSEILAKETKGSRGTDQNKNIQIELQSSLDVQKSLLEDKTYQIDSEERASIDVSSEGQNNSAEQDSYSNFQVYQNQLNMSHQCSHFNALTHQTFLGTPYALSSSQSQSENYFLSAYSERLGGK
nr:LOW QUALITY PROTEIN: protein TASOR-like [Pipistrellus kuhlii]